MMKCLYRALFHIFLMTFFGLPLCGLPHCVVETAKAAPGQELNLLVIQTDEHNFRTLGCYRKLMPRQQAQMWGDAVVETPHIDWIAENGAVCTSFYATTPVCSPSRGALMSGRYPQNTPVTTNNIPLDDSIVTFAELLRRQGYATGYAGKWHLDGGGKPQWAPHRKFGFDDNRYMFNRGHWKQLEDTPEGPRVKAVKEGQPTYAVQGANEESFTTDFLADKAVEFINAHKQAGAPFCYMVSFPDPHGPDTVRAPYDTMFQRQSYQTPRTFDVLPETTPQWGQPAGGFANMAPYYGMVKCIDDNVGKILNALRAAGLLERTIVVFTADHGDLRGEHHRQNKGVPFEGSAKIPFVIYAPGRIQSGTVVTQTLGCVDFLPTVLSLMGCPTGDHEQGRNASALLTSGTAPDNWVDVTFIRSTSGGSTWLGVVSDRYKLIFSPHDDPWLFDLQKDPDELTNFLRDSACRAMIRELSRELVAYAREFADPYAADPKVKADLEWAVSGVGPYVSTAPAKTSRKAGGAKRANQGKRRAKKSVKQ